MPIDITSLIFIAVAILIGLFIPLGLWLLLPALIGGGIGFCVWQTGYDAIGAILGISGVAVNVPWYLFWDRRL